MSLVQIKDGASFAAILIVILLTIVQITPIKINPWDVILHWIGDRLNSNIVKKVDQLEEKLDDHIQESMIKGLRDSRAQILDFCNSCMTGHRHTKEEFEFIIAACDDYEAYIEKNKIKNGVISAAIKEIRRIYDRCIQRNSFLREGEEDE